MYKAFIAFVTWLVGLKMFRFEQRYPGRFFSILLQSLGAIHVVVVWVKNSFRRAHADSAWMLSSFRELFVESFWTNRPFIWFAYLPFYIFFDNFHLEYAIAILISVGFFFLLLFLEYRYNIFFNERLVNFFFDRSLEHFLWISIFLFYTEVMIHCELCYISPLLEYLWP